MFIMFMLCLKLKAKYLVSAIIYEAILGSVYWLFKYWLD